MPAVKVYSIDEEEVRSKSQPLPPSFFARQLFGKSASAKTDEQAVALVDQVKNVIVQQIPPQTSFDVVDLQNWYSKENYAFILGAAYIAVYVTVLLAVAVSSTQTEFTKKFLAIDPSTIGQSVCTDIPVAVTGTFMGDSRGNWVTNPAFLQNSSIYEIEFTGSTVTEEQYKASFAKFENRLKELGKTSTKRDLAWNLVAWSSFHVADVKNKISFFTSANIATVMKHVNVKSMAVASRDGVCTKSGLVGSYNPITSSFELTIPRDVTPTPITTKAPTTPYPTPAPYTSSYLQTSYYISSDCSGPARKIEVDIPNACIANNANTGSSMLTIQGGIPITNNFASTDCTGEIIGTSGRSSGSKVVGSASIGSTTLTLVGYTGLLTSTTYTVYDWSGANAVPQGTTVTTPSSFSNNDLTLSQNAQASVAAGAMGFRSEIYMTASVNSSYAQLTLISLQPSTTYSVFGSGIPSGATVTTGNSVGSTLTLSTPTTAAVTEAVYFTTPNVHVPVVAALGSTTLTLISLEPSTTYSVQSVFGSGIPSGATVTTGNPVGSTLTLSTPTTAAVTGAVYFYGSGQNMYLGVSAASGSTVLTIDSPLPSTTYSVSGYGIDTDTIVTTSNTIGSTLILSKPTTETIIVIVLSTPTIYMSVSAPTGSSTLNLASLQPSTTYFVGSSDGYSIPSGTTVTTGSGAVGTSLLLSKAAISNIAGGRVSFSSHTTLAASTSANSPTLKLTGTYGLQPSTKYTVSGTGINTDTTVTTASSMTDTLTLSKTTTAAINLLSITLSTAGLCITTTQSDSFLMSVVAKTDLINNIIGSNAIITAYASSKEKCMSQTVTKLNTMPKACQGPFHMPCLDGDTCVIPDGQYWYLPGCLDDYQYAYVFSDSQCATTAVYKVSSPAHSYNCTANQYSNGPGDAFEYSYCSTQTKQIGGGSPTAAPSSQSSYPKVEPCPNQFILGENGFLMGQDSNQGGSSSITVSFDIRSVSTCIAVNLGIISTSDLMRTRVPFSLPTIKGNFYIDTFYPDMAEIFCIDEDGDASPNICFVVFNFEFFYPVFTSVDESGGMGRSSLCQCPSAASIYYCNQLKSMSLAMLFSRNTDTDTRFNQLVSLAKTMRSLILANSGDPFSIISKVSPPLINAASISSSEMPQSTLIQWMLGNTNFGLKSLDFSLFQSEMDGIGSDISAVSFGFKSTATLNEFNDNKVDLSQLSSDPSAMFKGGFSTIACYNTIYQAEALAKLGAKAPVELVQPFKQCHTTLLAAATTALGSANGLAQIARGLALTLLSMLLVYWVNNHKAGQADKKLVAPAEKARVLQEQLDMEKEELIHMVETIKASLEAVLEASSVSPAQKQMLSQQLAAANIAHHVNREPKTLDSSSTTSTTAAAVLTIQTK